MKLNQIYTSNSSFFKPDEVKENPPILTITEVGTQTNKDKQTGEDYTQIVLSFAQSDKKLGLNFTNANTIAELLKSDDTDDWIGRTIELYATMVKVGAEQKLGIRVMPKLPQQLDAEALRQAQADASPAVQAERAAFQSSNTPAFSGTTADETDIPF